MFRISQAAKVLLGVVVGDSSLVNKDVFLGVVAVDESIAILDVEPLDDASHVFSDQL